MSAYYLRTGSFLISMIPSQRKRRTAYFSLRRLDNNALSPCTGIAFIEVMVALFVLALGLLGLWVLLTTAWRMHQQAYTVAQTTLATMNRAECEQAEDRRRQAVNSVLCLLSSDHRHPRVGWDPELKNTGFPLSRE